MTTPIDSSSPFIGNAKITASNDGGVNTPVATDDGFLIRTMQDDLIELQKKEKNNPSHVNPHTEPTKKITAPPSAAPTPISASTVTPISTPVTKPATTAESFKTAASPQNIPPKVIRPVIQQSSPAPSKKDFIEIPIPAEKNVATNKKSHLQKTSLIVIILLIVIAIFWGLYYFLIKPNTQQPAAPSNIETAQQPTENPSDATINAQTEKYSLDKPNYLSIDITTLSTDDIKKTISDVAEEIKALPKNNTPYEFIVVDANNNPIAFPIFATAIKLNLSPSILNSLGENFSLFIYNDNDNIRLSFAIDINKNKTLQADLLKQEKTFITDAAFLFLNERPEITKSSFQDSVYKDASIRFFNVNSQLTMSVDYSVFGDKLIIATSKNSMRAVIDKLTAATAITTNVAPNKNKGATADSVSVDVKKTTSSQKSSDKGEAVETSSSSQVSNSSEQNSNSVSNAANTLNQ